MRALNWYNFRGAGHVQKGDFVENVGISVEAWCFQDQGIHTVNRPAKITLYNHSHAEKRGWFSKRTSDFKRWDDVVVPTRYKVDYYKSFDQLNEDISKNYSNKKSSIKFGYTLIDAGADIIVLKDDKQDIPIEEKHKIEIHESSSGFSILGLGKAGAPDSIGQLRDMHSAYNSGNMMGLTTATISAVARTIRTYEDLKNLGNSYDRITGIDNLNLENMLRIMSRFVEGPSLQFGTRSIHTIVEETKTHGNAMKAKNMVFHNAETTFCGTYEAKDSIDIETKTFVTFALPHSITNRTSVHQSGISVDLLSFALACMNPQIAGVTAALLGSASVSISSQDTKKHSLRNVPTTIRAEKNLNIKAQNGRITQAQIKAALVHAIFTDDLVVETLADSFESKSRGYGLSLGLGAFAAGGNSDGNKGDGFSGDNNVSGFMNFVGDLKDFVANVGVSSVNSSEFERKIDDYAAFVGTEEFYLKVGGVLKEKSAFLGHIRGDKSREKIKAKKVIHENVSEHRKKKDRSFQVKFGDVFTVCDAVCDLAKADESPKKSREVEQDGIGEDCAENTEISQLSEQEKVEELKRDIAEFQREAEKVVIIAQEAKKEKSKRQTSTRKIPDSNEVSDKEAEIRQNFVESLLAEPNTKENSLLEQQILDGFYNAIYSQAETSPRDQVKAFVPKNKAEVAIKEATLLRYRLEDFAQKHPEAVEFGGKVFIGAVYALQGIEYGAAAVTGGPFGIATKYSSQEAISHAVDTTVETSAEVAARHITSDEILQSEFANTIKVYSYVGLCAGSIKAGKKLVGSLVKGAQQSKRMRKVGEAGTYDKLTKPAGFNDGMQAHHMPSQKWLKANNMNADKGFAVMMKREQHIETRTYGKRQNQLDTNTSYRSELATDLNDYINVLKSDGCWTPEVRRSLTKGLDSFKNEFPDLFKKVMK